MRCGEHYDKFGLNQKISTIFNCDEFGPCNLCKELNRRETFQTEHGFVEHIIKDQKLSKTRLNLVEIDKGHGKIIKKKKSEVELNTFKKVIIDRKYSNYIQCGLCKALLKTGTR